MMKYPEKSPVDFFQNAKGKTIACPYSVRECPCATVSAPLTWQEVSSKANKDAFTILTVPDRIAAMGDLFQQVLTNKQKLSPALAALDKLK
jgi:bifunctional non-homologous end joining protein LigD